MNDNAEQDDSHDHDACDVQVKISVGADDVGVVQHRSIEKSVFTPGLNSLEFIQRSIEPGI